MTLSQDCDFLCITEGEDAIAKTWLDEGKEVAIISDEEKKSDDPRMKIYCLESPLQAEKIAKQIAWSAVMKKLHVVGNRLKKEIEYYHIAAHAILSEAADYWVGPMKNARANLNPYWNSHRDPYRNSYRRGMELKGAFEKVPAVIVGAGPSLEGKQLQKFLGRALIFAGGTALNALDVEPHFAASIDAAAPYRQFKIQPFSEVPFCYQARMNSANFSLVHGEKILFPDSACEALNWILDEESFDSGWTVGNFLTEIALLMGCSPIFFIGMDLCYHGGRKYAKVDAELPDGLVQVGDVLTQKDWILAARWTEGKRAKMFDLSQGILQLPKLDFEEAVKMCPHFKNLNVFEKVLDLPLKQGSKWDEWDASLRRCTKDFGSIEEEIVYQKLLQPLWMIWRPVFEREGENIELHRKLFFQKVLEEHVALVL